MRQLNTKDLDDLTYRLIRQRKFRTLIFLLPGELWRDWERSTKQTLRAWLSLRPSPSWGQTTVFDLLIQWVILLSVWRTFRKLKRMATSLRAKSISLAVNLFIFKFPNNPFIRCPKCGCESSWLLQPFGFLDCKVAKSRVMNNKGSTKIIAIQLLIWQPGARQSAQSNR